MKELMRVLLAIFRYPAAIVVAFVASIATMSYLPDLLPQWSMNNDSSFGGSVCLFSIGLGGVGAGSLCLPRNHQWIGSIFLLLLGLGFTFFVSYMFSEEDDSIISDLLSLVLLATGGLIPVVIHYLLSNKRPIKAPL